MQHTVQETPSVAAPIVRSLLTVSQFCDKHPAFTVGGLRWLLFHRDGNGLARAVVKVGRRVLLDADAFFQWLDRQNGRGEE